MYGSYVNEMDSSSLDSLDETGKYIHVHRQSIKLNRDAVEKSFSEGGAQTCYPYYIC